MIIEVKDTDVNVVNGELHIKITADIEKLLKKKVRLDALKEGDVFEIEDVEYIFLEHTNNGIACITKDLLTDKMIFDNNTNDWRNSGIRKYLNGKYLEDLESKVGSSNIITHEVDLTSNDGLKDYGTCKDKVSLLTCDMYRKYRYLLGKIDAWWWTLTSFSTPTSGYFSTVCCVRSDGDVDGGGYGDG